MVGGIEKWYNYFGEKSSGFLLPSNSTQEIQKHMSTKKLYENIPNSFIHNSPKLETTEMSINKAMDKQTAVHSYKLYNLCKILFSNKKR